MKKIWFVICLLGISFATKAQPDSGFSYSECHKVISALQESLKNDSLVVDYFFRNYKVIGILKCRTSRIDIRNFTFILLCVLSVFARF